MKKLIKRQLEKKFLSYLWEKLNKNICGKFESKLSMEIERKLWSGFEKKLRNKLRVNIKWKFMGGLWRALDEEIN
jgi:hypothetical protein